MDANRAQISMLTYKIQQLQVQNQILRQSQSAEFTFKPQSVEQLLYEKQSYDSVLSVTRRELYASLAAYQEQQKQILSDYQSKADMQATNEYLKEKIAYLTEQARKNEYEIEETKKTCEKLCGERNKQKSIAETLEKQNAMYYEEQKQLRQDLESKSAYYEQLYASFAELQKAYQEVVEEKDSLLTLKKMLDDIAKTRQLDCEATRELQEPREADSMAQLSGLRSSGPEGRYSGAPQHRSGQIRSSGAGDCFLTASMY